MLQEPVSFIGFYTKGGINGVLAIKNHRVTDELLQFFLSFYRKSYRMLQTSSINDGSHGLLQTSLQLFFNKAWKETL